MMTIDSKYIHNFKDSSFDSDNELYKMVASQNLKNIWCDDEKRIRKNKKRLSRSLGTNTKNTSLVLDFLNKMI